MADTVNLKINSVPVSVPPGTTVLEAARQIGVEIPTLCYMKDISEIGACRICVVDVKGARTHVASCVYPVAEGMEVRTHTPDIIRSRTRTLELILSNHRMDCLTCLRNQNCELQKLAADFGIQETRFPSDAHEPQIEDSAVHLVRDNSKCVLCRRCSAVCKHNQSVGVIGPAARGFDTHIACAYGRDLGEVACVSCGQCITVCPTGALTESCQTDEVWSALADPKKHVVVGVAPSIRVTLGECFGLPVGANVEGQMVSALRLLGFNGVFDIDAAADLTIMEEGTEFMKRLTGGGPLPLITSCSPGWVRFCEQYFPEFLPNVSSCKSPQQMFGALMKTYYAEKYNLAPEDVFVVGIMPCTAKKYEIRRGDWAVEGLPDVDVALTTRELSRMISRAGIMFRSLPSSAFDAAFGVASGAGLIFGATGGVMEAALRTVSSLAEGKPPASLDFTEVRGTAGVKEASYTIRGRSVRVAACSGLANARKVLQSVKDGSARYDFIEIMCCPGGCVGGGGQPVQPQSLKNFSDLRALRAAALYKSDADMPLRLSHESPLIKQLYREFLQKPGSPEAHKILHTHIEKGEAV
ncbi:MAG: [FeFe] hydrogenase, group A [Oscillospiraceae bacterium]|jgi:NADP-reducing hydrogenase subunit HndD|nr:[FeFe] hydrogenase, group A [Oscillospiraceae bacterium]